MDKKAATKNELVDAIADATRKAAEELFGERKEESFYYFSLTTTGEALPPVVTAWSIEALDREVERIGGDERARQELKWSYADSPYYAYGEKHFELVRTLFEDLGPLNFRSDASSASSFDFRIEAMVAAMKRLDAEGVFGTGEDRDAMFVNVEVFPPDASNVERALRLNPAEAMKDWLIEAAGE